MKIFGVRNDEVRKKSEGATIKAKTQYGAEEVAPYCVLIMYTDTHFIIMVTVYFINSTAFCTISLVSFIIWKYWLISQISRATRALSC